MAKFGRAITKENLMSITHRGGRPLNEASAKSLLKLYKDDDVKADAFMDACNAALGGHGVEAIEGGIHVSNYYQNIVALYVNMGDTYDGTILYDTVARKFYVTSWGDFVEAMTDEYEIS